MNRLQTFSDLVSCCQKNEQDEETLKEFATASSSYQQSNSRLSVGGQRKSSAIRSKQPKISNELNQHVIILNQQAIKGQAKQPKKLKVDLSKQVKQEQHQDRSRVNELVEEEKVPRVEPELLRSNHDRLVQPRKEPTTPDEIIFEAKIRDGSYQEIFQSQPESWQSRRRIRSYGNVESSSRQPQLEAQERLIEQDQQPSAQLNQRNQRLDFRLSLRMLPLQIDAAAPIEESKHQTLHQIKQTEPENRRQQSITGQKTELEEIEEESPRVSESVEFEQTVQRIPDKSAESQPNGGCLNYYCTIRQQLGGAQPLDQVSEVSEISQAGLEGLSQQSMNEQMYSQSNPRAQKQMLFRSLGDVQDPRKLHSMQLPNNQKILGQSLSSSLPEEKFQPKIVRMIAPQLRVVSDGGSDESSDMFGSQADSINSLDALSQSVSNSSREGSQKSHQLRRQVRVPAIGEEKKSQAHVEALEDEGEASWTLQQQQEAASKIIQKQVPIKKVYSQLVFSRKSDKVQYLKNMLIETVQNDLSNK